MRIESHLTKDIKVGLLFSYYNAEKETPRALDPWYPHVDHIIAIDGRYKTPITPEMRSKGLTDYSTDNSEHLLKTRYHDKITHERFFGTQIEKRQKCFDISADLGCDIVIVWDSDDIIHPDYQDWERFWKQIAYIHEYNKDEYVFKMYAWIPSREEWTPQHNEVLPNTWVKYDRIHKGVKDLRYAQTHYTWALKTVTDEQINKWRWHKDHINKPELENPYLRQGTALVDGIRISTNRALRTKAQLTFGDGWTWQNMHWEAYEYQTKPYWKSKNFELVYEALKKRKYPNLEYYFSPMDNVGRVYLIPYYINEKGDYVIIKTEQNKEDGTTIDTEEVLPLQEAITTNINQ